MIQVLSLAPEPVIKNSTSPLHHNYMQVLDLPEPGPFEIEHSAELSRLIAQRIVHAGGWISFDEYMELALYAPGLGYYSAGAQKFGEQGDFTTSPEVSPLFAQTLARPIAKLIDDIPNAKIIEFGAGSGKLAVDLLLALQRQNVLPHEYLIVELSGELRQRQTEIIQQKIPHLMPRVKWLSALPDEPLDAIVIANEVLDAMPIKRFRLQGEESQELGVSLINQNITDAAQAMFCLHYKTTGSELSKQIGALNINANEVNYYSEMNLRINPWIKLLAQSLSKAAVYIIDYGYTRKEYYAEERHMGTFIGYYRHRSLDAPLWYPGLQDLTAFVDFTEVAEAAIAHGFDVDGFTSQGNFLMNAGLVEVVESSVYSSEIERLKIVQQMKTLSLPGEMGESFKVIGLSKGLDKNIPGFEVRDQRYSL